MQPPIPADKMNINWWMLRMVEDGEVDDDFPPFDRTKGLASFTTVNNASARGGGRQRAGSTAFDEFALVAATEEEFQEHQEQTPQKLEDEEPSSQQSAEDVSVGRPREDSGPKSAAGPASNTPAPAISGRTCTQPASSRTRCSPGPRRSPATTRYPLPTNMCTVTSRRSRTAHRTSPSPSARAKEQKNAPSQDHA